MFQTFNKRRMRCAIMFSALYCLAVASAASARDNPRSSNDPLTFDGGLNTSGIAGVTSLDAWTPTSNAMSQGDDADDPMRWSSDDSAVPPQTDDPGISSLPTAKDRSSNDVAQWFSSLSEQEQEQVLINAAREGLADENGRPLTRAMFLAVSKVMDQEMTRQGLGTKEKHRIFEQIESQAGIKHETDAPLGRGLHGRQ